MNLNVLKGLLIILVVIDHNDVARMVIPAFLLGMGFHVVGFMTIPFLKSPPRIATQELADYAFRLYYPFLVLTCVLWAVVTLTGDSPLGIRLAELAHVLYSGNADLLKRTVNMGLLWFLPSFLSLVILRAALAWCAPSLRYAALAMLFAIHPFVGTFAKELQDYLPMGLIPAVYIFPLALSGAVVQRRVFERLPRYGAVLLSLSVFALIKLAQIALGMDNEIGFATVADYTTPLPLLLHDLEGISGTLMLFQIARLDWKGVIEKCGQYSMQIYLFHAFLALGIYKASTWLFVQADPLPLFIGSAVATVLATLVAAVLTMRFGPLKRLIFPRDAAELLHGAQRPAAGAAGSSTKSP